MADIVKINTVEVANIVKLNGVQPASFSKVLGQDFVTGYTNTYSLYMDAANDQAIIGGVNDTFFGTGDFTLSWWIRFGNHSSPTNTYMFNRGRLYNTSETSNHFQIIYKANIDKIQFLAAISGSTSSRIIGSSMGISDDTWFHLAISNDKDGGSTGMKLYVNGNHNNTAAAINANLDAGATGKQFGLNRYSGGNYRQLEYDEIAIHHTVLDADNISAIYNSGSPINLSADSGNYNTSSNLAHWWKLNNDGTNSVGTGDITLANGAAYSNTNPAGS